MDRIGRFFLDRPIWVTALVLLALVALPVAVWLDLYNLSEQNLRTQAASLNRVISIVRTYYATNVVARVLSAKGRTQPLHSYREVPGAIPIPATLSIELGEALSADLGDVAFRFVSDFPFVGRRPHDLDPFERRALQEFRKPGGAERFLVDSTGTVFDQRITLATPVVMSEACVACHNSHPGSPKWDWGWATSAASRQSPSTNPSPSTSGPSSGSSPISPWPGPSASSSPFYNSASPAPSRA